MFNAVNESDVTDIVKLQVEKAKEGDTKAIAFVSKFLLGANTPVTFIQENHYHNEIEAQEMDELPGAKGKIQAMRERAARGQDLHSEHDGQPNLD